MIESMREAFDLKKLFVLGDSISIHYGPYLEKLCEGIYAYSRKTGEEGFDDSDFSQNNNGGDSRMVRRFTQWMSDNGKLNYDVILLNCGLHDVKLTASGHQVEKEEYLQNLTEVIELFKNNGCKIIWVRTTPVFDEVHNKKGGTFTRSGSDVEAYNAIADVLMDRREIPVIDLFSFTMPYLPDGYADHVHFKEPIRSAQADFIFSEIQKTFC